VRYVKIRRTTGTAQTVRRGGKTTAGDLMMKAKLLREEDGGRKALIQGSERRDEGPPPIGTACGESHRSFSILNSISITKLTYLYLQLSQPVLQDNAAGRETVDFTGPRERRSVRILSGCMQSRRASAQRCNEEIFEGSVAATHFIEALMAPSASHTLL
ncbi:hypothetical protein CF326_g9881, partial [Tilletia indica]